MNRLTNPQTLIYNMEKYVGGAVAVICGSVLIDGKIEPSQLTEAVAEIFRLNDVLRTRIVEKDGTPYQHVIPYEPHATNVLRFDSEVQLHSYTEVYAREPIPMSGELCELQAVFLPNRFGLLIKCHHIIGDAWTLTLICSQLNAILAGEKPTAFQYADYVENEAAYMQSPRYAKDRAFFMEQFKICDEVTYLSEKNGDSFAAQRKTFHISVDQTAQIRSYAEQHHTSPFALFLTAFAVYFSRVKMNVEKFYIGTPVLNRSTFKEKNTLGMFINTVPILAAVDYTRSFAENLADMQATVFSVLRHQKFHYNDLLTAIRQEYGFTEKLYDVVLSYQNAAVAGTDARIETTWYHNGVQTESLQIHIDDRDGGGAFRIQMDYRTDKFAQEEVEAMYAHILNLLSDAIMNDSKRPADLNLLSADEKQLLLQTFNDTAADYPRDKCVHQLFEEQVLRTPKQTALVFSDKSFSYERLNGLANGLAWRLKAKGIGQGDIVAILAKRGYELVVAILAVLKAGAAYLPIDSNYPTDRIETIIADSNCKIVLTYGVDWDKNNVVAIEGNIAFSTQNLQNINSSSDICAIIYTSGTTGQPKGTLICHRGLINYTYANHALYANGSCVIGFSIYSFDAFFLDTISPMLRGVTAVMATEKQQFQQSEFEQLIRENPNCNLFITPAKLKLFLDNSIDRCFYKRINNICIGGEVFPQEFVGIFAENTNVFNVYGPTECSMWTLEFPVKSTDVTLGHPLANTQIYIVDAYSIPVPIGVTGELCIAGDGVGAGYLNRPELTAEKFISNPFGEGKLYKTGDLAYWREDGNIVYVGRNDFQVKIRGLRIELGEIENVITGIEDIGQAVVVVRKDHAGHQLICAFYTEVAPVELEKIKSVLRKKLPRYMMPHIFTKLDCLPMTTSGKLNRKALPDVDLAISSSSNECIAPEGQREQVLASIIEQVLGYSPIGRDDDFFDFGGDSLKAIEFVSKAHTEGIYFSLQNVFDYPTVRMLCQCIDEGDKVCISYEDADFTQINHLLAKNRLNGLDIPSKTDVGNLFLTGATGFLGIHLLADYLDHDTGIAYCLVRGKDQADSERRLADRLKFYFGEKYTTSRRIRVVCGDLQRDNFALTEDEYQELQSEIDTVINAAASVKHYGSYQYFQEVNVESVRRLIDFCQESHAKFIHTSTLSVSGYGFDNLDEHAGKTGKYFSESSLYIGQSLENVYAHSKFEAEKLVLDAMIDGLPANIMRMGNLTNRFSDGVFQVNYETNASAQRMKGLLELGLLPDYLVAGNAHMEFTPIDEAARAIMTITRHFSMKQTVFHISNPKIVSFDRLAEIFRELGYSLKVVSGAKFTDALYETAKQADTKHIFESFVNYLGTDGQLAYNSSICIDSTFTEEYLQRMGVTWSEIGIEYLRKYVQYFKKIGYWEM